MSKKTGKTILLILYLPIHIHVLLFAKSESSLTHKLFE